MTKPLKAYPEAERREIAKRRVASNTGGLGYHSAVAYLERLSGKKKSKKS